MNMLQHHLLLILLTLSAGVYALAGQLGVDLSLAVTASSLITLAIAFALERYLPYRREWQRNRGDMGTDLVSAGVLLSIADPIAKAVVPAIAVLVYSRLELSHGLASLPLVAQVLLVLLLAELGKYWSHRAHHAVRGLWWLHAMHHSSERLYVLNGLRFHPLNYWVNFFFGMFPVLALGASPEAVLGYLALSQPVVLLQHANIDLRSGWLNRLLSTPEAHRWHHSTVPAEANRNFGNAILLWDHIFGTYKGSHGFASEKQVGLFATSSPSYPVTHGYFKQLVSMFRPPCCAA